MSYQDEHDRAPGRCARLRSITQRPSEIHDTREKSKGSAYKKSVGMAFCSKCCRRFYSDAMENGVCRECPLMKEGN